MPPSRPTSSWPALLAKGLTLTLTLGACAAEPATVSLTLGEAEVLVPEGSLGVHGFPNQGISLLPDPAGKVRLITAAADATYLFQGDDLAHLTTATQVLSPGEAQTFDSGAAGIGAIYTAPDGTLYGFYHGEDRDGVPAFPSGRPGYYATVGLATSTDGGSSWSKVGAVITSSQSRGALASSNRSDGGAGEPGLALSPDGRYLYLYFTEHSREENLGVQICVARADLQQGPPLPGSFSKRYYADFTEPGLGGHCSPVINGIGFDYADTLGAHVTYSAFAALYYAVFSVIDWYSLENGDGLGASALSFATSSDGLTWTSPRRLVAANALPSLKARLAWQGTLVWDDDKGQTGWLLYGESPSWGPPEVGGLMHTLTGNRVTLERD